MKKTLTLIALPLLLAGCKGQYSADASALLKNPLYAELYSEQMVDTMVSMEIQEDPIIQDEAKHKIILDTKEEWFAVAKQARKDQRNGSKGAFISMKEQVDGEVLLQEGVLHIGPTFFSDPGPSLHLFISKAVDPRDVSFPDDTAVDVGLVDVPYAAQSFSLPSSVQNTREYRSVVLFDTKLERLYGFAQINPLN